ncbi:Hpc2-related domain [Lasallia pustulata]|uniref:Hpc2-related domain n=1 Tax=Lasallia pustulata TaxID=136370 RepID=A0A1W5DB68_9LECA|nr:Hpc2-related domain [Lasallia pustulata]
MSTAVALGGRDEGEGGGASYSSSPELSSPPKSPDSPTTGASPAPALGRTNHAISHSHPSHLANNVGGAKSSSAGTNTTAPATRLAKDAAPTTTAAAKKPRKKKDGAANNNNSNHAISPDARESKPRKRAPAASATVSSSSSTASKKKQKAEAPSDSKPPVASAPRQTKIPHLVASLQASFQLGVPATAASHQNGNNEAIPAPTPHLAFLGPGQQIPRSSGQNFDPVRSSTMEPPSVPHNPFSPPLASTPPKPANRASASPSIASLIDPPSAPLLQSRPFSQESKPGHDNKVPIAASPSKPYLASPVSLHVQPAPVSASPDDAIPCIPNNSNHATSDMDIDTDLVCLPTNKAPATTKKSTTGTSTGPPSSAPSPKPPRHEKTPLPLPPGNGLLSSALFGGPASDSAELDKIAPTVILHVPLNGENNRYVNFARMAEERYGFNALHPRLAAQRERLARVAAAGAAIENASKQGGASTGSAMSGDEMSVDLSDNEGEAADSNVEMGGVMGANGGSDAPDGKEVKKAAPRKRRMKEDEYDKGDPFVDDTELAWEEQAAASKDGFFVYSGPLVPEGEKPTVERADGTVKRGRGRGRGGTARAGGSTRGGATAGGPAAMRGAAAVRKPRVTKAARALMEQEKVEREKMAVLAAKPSTYPG